MLRRITNLVGVELTKLIHQRLFYIALILIVLTVVVSVLIGPGEGKKSGEDLGSPVSAGAKVQLRPDGGFGPLTNGCLNGFKLAAIFILIFATISISSETTTGTIRMVLIRPISRSELFFAKATSLIIITVFIILLIELISLALTDAVYGFANVTDPTFPDTPFPPGVKELMTRYTLYSFVLIILPLIAIIFMGLFVSILVENVGMAIALAVLVYLSIDYVMLPLFDNAAPYFFSYYRDFYLNNLNGLSQMDSNTSWQFLAIDNWLGFETTEIIKPHWQNTVFQSILVPISYIIIFSIPSLIILKKKDILV